jgi:hypothetical protein
MKKSLAIFLILFTALVLSACSRKKAKGSESEATIYHGDGNSASAPSGSPDQYQPPPANPDSRPTARSGVHRHTRITIIDEAPAVVGGVAVVPVASPLVIVCPYWERDLDCPEYGKKPARKEDAPKKHQPLSSPQPESSVPRPERSSPPQELPPRRDSGSRNISLEEREALEITDLSPQNGATHVDLSTPIQIGFSKPLNKSSVKVNKVFPWLC